MIRSVGACMAIRASTAIRVADAVVARQIHMPAIRVAVQAKERLSRHQQIRLSRAMRRVARYAALTNGGVFPEERTALLRVAGIARVIDAILGQQAGCTAMNVMAA